MKDKILIITQVNLRLLKEFLKNNSGKGIKGNKHENIIYLNWSLNESSIIFSIILFISLVLGT